MASLLTSVTYLKNVHWYRSQYTLKHAVKLLDQVQVIYKSKNYLILNKPADLICYQFNESYKNVPSLYEYLKEKFPFNYDPRITGGFHVLHRLDAATSGVICVPLNYFSQRIAVQAFTSGNAEKYYLALVYGLIDLKDSKTEFTINVPIGDDSNNLRYSRCTIFDKHGNKNENCVNPQDAITKVKLLEYGTYKGKDCTKVLIQPVSGKRHQIRVHLKHAGYPIVGDLTYGIDDFDSYRTMLHSYKLVLKINTKQRMFLKGKASDPFINAIDPDWKPTKTINELKI